MADYQGFKMYGGKPVSGVGNGAIFSSGSIFLIKGATVVQVGLFRSAADMNPPPSPQMVSLARAVSAKL
jgi:hypothetical protein